MRLICLPFKGLFTEDEIKYYTDVPFFDGEKHKSGAYVSNTYIFVNSVQDPENLRRACQDRYRGHLFAESSVTALVNTIAYYEIHTDRYWVTKNRFTGELGWLSRESFNKLIDLENNPSTIMDTELIDYLENK